MMWMDWDERLEEKSGGKKVKFPERRKEKTGFLHFMDH